MAILLYSKEYQSIATKYSKYNGIFDRKFKKGLTYNSLVSARSALSHYLPCDIVNHSTVSTFLKGIYILIPPPPKYLAI